MPDPTAIAPETPLLQEALAHWESIRQDRRMPPRDAFDPMSVPRLLPNIVLLEVQHDPLDFLYKVVGNTVNEHSGTPFSGMRMSDFPERRAPNEPWLNSQRVVETGNPSASTVPYVGPHKEFLKTCQVTLPLSAQDDENTVTHIIIVIDYVQRHSEFRS